MNRFSHYWLNYLLCLVLASYLMIIFSAQSPIAAENITPPTTTEIRGVWLTNVASGVFFVPWGIERAINQLAKLKFNRIYPVVWNRGHTFYHSAVAKQFIGQETQPLLNIMHNGEDVLAKLTRLSNPKGLSVIPWFEYGFMTPPNSELAKLHPDWLTTTRSPNNPIPKTPPEEINHDFFGKQSWLNPLHPEVQEFTQALLVEVASNYDVDGIQLDDHFGMPVLFGYDRFTVKLYQQEHHGKSPPNDPFNTEWMRWRADKITEFMQKIYQAVKAVKPNAKISLSPNSQTFAYKYYLQDWDTWVKQGLVQELVLQVSRDDKSNFIAELNQPAVKFASTQIPVAVAILSGTFSNPVKIEKVREQVKLVRDNKFAGFSFFYWESLWGYIAPESPPQRRRVFSQLFDANS
jgi:uncharacterized lipoprotein YddW (UPF0748 family)